VKAEAEIPPEAMKCCRRQAAIPLRLMIFYRQSGIIYLARQCMGTCAAGSNV
jgi:hypothetical protein